MIEQHYPALAAAYLAALAGWFVACYLLPSVWPDHPTASFEKPWLELVLALLGAVGVLAVGQLWSHGIRLPEGGTLGPVLAAINQLLIFMPILLVPILRQQSWNTAWLPREKLPIRLLVGLLLAVMAVTTYTLLRAGADPPWVVLGRIWWVDNVDKMVQVFLEDIAIAIIFVRFAAVVGVRWAIVVVAALFAAGHLPAMIAKGASPTELLGLLRDVVLGVAVIMVLQRSRDVVWFWFIHYSMDMTQFERITFGQ